ncbi:UNVERIFIED_CONTAM: hypothetical protein GTU68_057830 [Idotea baltica]|nr:hypothetical protein [Idotea baltica]
MANPLYDALFDIHKGKQGHFIIDPLQDNNVSYDTFLNQAAQCANALQGAGLSKGDRLVAQVGKSVSALALYAGCVKAGIVYLPLNSAYTANEVEYFLSDSEAKLLVCDPSNESALARVAELTGAKLLTQSAAGDLGTLIDNVNSASTEFATVDCELSDLAALLYTSGTTGRSKGAMLSQENLLSNAQVLVELWQFTDKDILLHALPVFHTHGLFVATHVCLLSGAQMIFEPGFKTDRMIQLIPHSTSMMGVPTFYTRLLDEPEFDKALTKNMRLFVSGSAPLLADTHVQFSQRTGHRILERYGMTETNMNTSNPYDGERRPGTVGFALPGVEVKITDPETGETLAMGEVGQLEVRGPNVFNGYWKMPEKTAKELSEDGFFITGDLATIDKDGYISIVGRDKDLIISGGYNIYPKEIELILDECSGVVESAVVGVPHPDFGESVVAVLVGKESDIDLDAIAVSISDSLARFKHPRKLLVLDSLPRNAMGKVQKNELRDRYSNLFA